MDWAAGLAGMWIPTPQHILGIRLLLAAVFGAMIGFEREGNHGSAGLRTHILIAVAACLFTLLAFEIYEIALAGSSNNRPHSGGRGDDCRDRVPRRRGNFPGPRQCAGA